MWMAEQLRDGIAGSQLIVRCDRGSMREPQRDPEGRTHEAVVLEQDAFALILIDERVKVSQVGAKSDPALRR